MERKSLATKLVVNCYPFFKFIKIFPFQTYALYDVATVIKFINA